MGDDREPQWFDGIVTDMAEPLDEWFGVLKQHKDMTPEKADRMLANFEAEVQRVREHCYEVTQDILEEFRSCLHLNKALRRDKDGNQPTGHSLRECSDPGPDDSV